MEIAVDHSLTQLNNGTLVGAEGMALGNQSNGPEIMDEFAASWGFGIDELYSLATSFFKEKEGKAFNLSYKDKLNLVAFTQQVTHGCFVPEKFPPVGYLDVIGQDRRQAWSALGNMSTRDAKAGFISLLDRLCPLFQPFVQAHKVDEEEKERIRKLEEEERRKEEEEEMEQIRLEQELKYQEERELQRQLNQKQLIQEALNRQTFHQFKSYAEQQCPGNPEKQAVLIRQLQEQHYQQYMNQMLQQQHQQLYETKDTENHMTSTILDDDHQQSNFIDEASVQSSGESTEEEIETTQMATASMWTRKDIQDFKENIRKEGGDGIIKVGHGETVTVRVPTHNDGSCLFWEFATDSFDIGFGVYFEWTKNPDTQVSVHISESEEEDDDDEDNENLTGDIEKGVPSSNKPLLSVIIPVFRRDCHEEVYAGSHVYPGQGVYLLKFDNSYSLWRSKTLYYRVYYTR